MSQFRGATAVHSLAAFAPQKHEEGTTDTFEDRLRRMQEEYEAERAREGDDEFAGG